MAEPRRLRGLKATATTCIASVHRSGLLAAASEDGFVSWFDLRCKDVLFTMEVGNNNPVTSLCFKPAAADDAGEVKIVDIQQQCLYKTLRAGHESICSAVQFLHWRPWEVISGGLDSKLVMWDFSRGRQNKILDFGLPDAGSSNSQLLNPAFIHALVVPELDMVDKVGKICVVARGDGVVNVINIEQELAASKSRKLSKPKKGTKSNSENSASCSDSQSQDQNNGRLQLDYTVGGHTAAVSCVTFSMFGERGKFIISGGNDKSVKVWDLSNSVDAGQNNNDNNLLHLNINLKKKVNWVCTTPSDSENLVVCDTSKVVKVYSVG